MLDKNVEKLAKSAKGHIALIVILQLVMLAINITMLYSFSYTLFSSQLIKFSLIFITLVILSRVIFSILIEKQAFLAGSLIKRNLRERIANHLFDQRGNLFNLSQAQLSQLSTQGVDELEVYSARYIPQLFYSILAPIILFIVISFIDFRKALILLIALPLIPMLLIGIRKMANKVLSKYWNSYSDVAESFLESLFGLTLLKNNRADGRRARYISTKAENFRVATMKVLAMQLHSITLMDLVAYGFSSLGMIIAVWGAKNNDISIHQALFIILLAADFFLPLRALGGFFHVASTGIASSKKIFKFLGSKDERTYKRDINLTGQLSYKIENLNFNYPNKDLVLENLNLELPKTGFICIAGQSGSGKSTLAKILSGSLYSENVKFYNENLGNIDREFLDENICYLQANAKLFGSTLKEAALGSDLREFNIFEDKELSDNSSNISGGERQRIALARALNKEFKIYIFDEATSNIDKENEAIIKEKILKKSKESLVIYITHRLNITKDSDYLIFIEKRNLFIKGSFDEVYQNSKEFKALYDKQMQLEGAYV